MSRQTAKTAKTDPHVLIVLLAFLALWRCPLAFADEAKKVADAIEKTMQRHAAQVHRCFEKALADRLDVSGKVEIEIELGPAGKVKKTTVLSEGKEMSPSLSACVLASTATWKVEGVEPGASVILPFVFQGQMNQFVIKVADVPDRGPGVAKGSRPARTPPFTVKVLADEINVRARHVSLTLLSVGPASRVAMHRHPSSAKALYLLKGHARLLGPADAAPVKIDEGMVVFVPLGYPHVIENMGRQSTAVFLQVFTPPGPERVYRDPADAKGRAQFEVIRDPRTAKAPHGANVVVRGPADAPALPILGGKGTARILLEPAVTGSAALALDVVELAPGLEIPEHSHPGATELLYVVSGSGTMTVGRDGHPFGPEQVIAIPPDQPHGAKIAAGEKAIVIQAYAPAGPEQRFRSTGGTAR